MKVFLIFAAFVVFGEVTSSSRSRKSALQTAFVNISEDLVQWNRMETVFVTNIGVEDIGAKFATGMQRFNKRLANISEQVCLHSSAFVFLDSVASLKRFNEFFLPCLSMSQQVFIHCRNATYDELSMISTNRVEMPLVKNEYFILEEEKSIRLLTFMWFEPETCNVAQLVEVNSFDKSSGRWQHGIFKRDKFSNFNGCQINFFILEAGYPEFNMIEIDYKNKAITKCSGYVCAILVDLANVLNYTYHMDMKMGSGKIWPEIPIHVTLSALSLNYNSKNYFTLVTRPVYFLEYFIAIPPGEEYNQYEKLVLPFDELTWMWISITFASAVITIFVLRFVRPDIANFVIGRRNETPVLNVVRAFFGISQIVSPGGNFARYLLMMFILFSLVIRTAYQGVMFEFLQKEMRKPTVTTIDEMVEQNFTFYMQWNFNLVSNGFSCSKRARIVDSWSFDELYAAYGRVFTAGSKVGAFYNRDIYLNVIELELKKQQLPKLLPGRYMLENRALALQRFNFFHGILNRKLQQYIEADLINYNTRTWRTYNDPNRLKKYVEPFAILTLGQLEAGFVVCSVPLVLSIFVFAAEWLLTLKDLVVFLTVFKKYFDLKELERKSHSELMKNKVAALQAIVQKRKDNGQNRPEDGIA